MVENSTQLKEYAEALRSGSGPVAVDAERASGYRYGQRAYLVQMRRNGSGTGLIDPVPLPDLTLIQDAIADSEWVLHAANQDLPCLAELGLVPTRGSPASRPASSVSKIRFGFRPISARQGRSWLAACSTHSSSAIAACRAERSGSGIGSISPVPDPLRRSWTR